MFRTILFSLLLSVLTLSAASAQHNKQARKERVEAARVTYLTDKMKLSPEQAQKFWPVYNELDAKRKELKQKSREFRTQDMDALTDAQLREGIIQMLDNRQKEIELEKAYLDRFLGVISAKQLATMYQSEKEFMRLLLKRMDEKRADK